MAEPQFIDTDIEQLRADIKAHYETLSGKPLNPADVENLILDVLAYREGRLRVGIQNAALQNLVDFSRAPVLDYLGALVGAERLAATGATCTMVVALVTGHTGVTVPQGTRVRSTDGKATFTLVEDVLVPIGTFSVNVDAICTEAGEAGNGFGIGVVNRVLDPQAYIVSISNTNITAGGAEQETDDAFRVRIKLAASRFTTAGSTGAYKFHALSANPALIDVGVLGPQSVGVSFLINPGEVYLLPLMNDGSVTPSQILTQVDQKCSPETVRPLTDTVFVQPPTQIPYTLTADLTIFVDAIGADVQQEVEDALQAYVDFKRQSLGQDIVESQVKARCQLEGKVYKVDLPGFSDIIIGPDQYGFCTSITVNIIGSTNG